MKKVYGDGINKAVRNSWWEKEKRKRRQEEANRRRYKKKFPKPGNVG